MAPIAVGAAVVTNAGQLPARRVIHAPTMEQPGTKVGVENVRRATRAALLAAAHHNLELIAIPGMTFSTKNVNENALEGKAVRKEIVVNFTGKEGDPTMTLLVYSPKSKAKSTWPTWSSTGRWRAPCAPRSTSNSSRRRESQGM